MMCKFWKIVNRYVDESDWKTFTLLKTCLFALGVLCGMSVRKKDKEVVTIAAGAAFVGCYIPLMVKLARIVVGELRPAKAEPSEEEDSEPEQAPEAEQAAEPEQAPEAEQAAEPEQAPEAEQAAEPEQAPEDEQASEEEQSADESAAEAEESDEAEPEAEQTEAEPEE